MTYDLFDEEENIHINRGDRLLFEYSIDNDGTDYIFQENDYVTFGIYKKLNEEPLVYEKFIPITGTTSIDIDIPKEKMKIDDYINQRKEYIYEIQLNDEVTTHGYKKNIINKLYLYPEGRNPNVES